MTFESIKDILILLVGGGGATLIRLFFEKRKARAEVSGMEQDLRDRSRKSMLDAYDSLEDAFFSQQTKIIELSAKLVQAQILMAEMNQTKDNDTSSHITND